MSVYCVEDDVDAKKNIKDGAVRCTGPDGVAFGEAAPEDVNKQLKAEADRKKVSIKKINKK